MSRALDRLSALE